MTTITFGKYKGKTLEQVPASYLLWIWDAGVHGEGSLMHDFIVDNWDDLTRRCPEHKVMHYPKPNGLAKFEDFDGKPNTVTVNYED